jgi:hypothetical protein
MLFASDMTVRRHQNGDRYGKTESISATLIYHYVLQRNKRLTACVVPAWCWNCRVIRDIDGLPDSPRGNTG